MEEEKPNDELEKCRKENEMLRKALEDSFTEKTALDKMYVSSLKSSLNDNKTIVMYETEIQKLKAEMQRLSQAKEKEACNA